MKLELFKNNEFGAVRVLADERGDVWFALVDVCNALGIKNPRDAKTRLKKDGVGITDGVDSLGRKSKITIINEANLYRLIFQSKKQEAIKFQDWVVEEVIPAIRKHGGYLTPQKVEEVLLNPDTIIKLATELKKEREEKEKYKQKVIELKPKAFFAEVVSNSDEAILVREFAKLISKGNFSIGEKKLYKWLREQGYLMSNNQPYQRYVDMGIFKVIERSRTDDKGTKIYYTTKITGKGQVYLQKKIYDFFNVKVGA